MFAEILIIVLCLLLVQRRWRLKKMFRLGNEIKSDIPSLPLLGHSYLFVGNAEHRMKILKMFGRNAIKIGGVVGLWHGSKLYVVVADPEIAECTLKNFVYKDEPKEMQVTFDNGHILPSVPIWRPRRKISAATFNQKNFNNFMSIFNEKSKLFVDLLQRRVGKGDFSIWDNAATYTMDAICESTLGVQFGTKTNPEHPFLIAVGNCIKLVTSRICQPWLHSDYIYFRTTYYIKLLRHRRYAMKLINRIIGIKRRSLLEQKEIKSSSDTYKDGLKPFLDILIESSSIDRVYTNLELQEETLVIIVAGSDASAVGISFITLMLSEHLDMQEKIYQEILDTFGDSDRTIEADDLPKLRYLDAFVNETLRLYPPVPVIVRTLEQDIKTPTGINLVEGCGVLINIWAIHRNPKYWGDDADLFRPERFINLTLKNPAAFMPFSHGPRSCLGYQYAMMSMKTALTTLIRRYRVLPAAGSSDTKSTNVPLRVKFDITMRHVDNYMVQLELRN